MCNKHIVLFKSSFNTYQQILITKVWFCDNGITEGNRIITFVIEMVVKGISKRMTLKDVLHIPKRKKNLFLVSKHLTHGYKVQFDMNECFIKTIEVKEIAKRRRDGNSYIINWKRINRIEIVEFCEFQSNKDKVDIWMPKEWKSFNPW